MATTVQVGDIIAIRVWTALNDQAAVNTYNFQAIASTGTGVTDVDVAAAFVGFMGTFYGNLCSNATLYKGVQVYFVKRISGGALPNPANDISGAGNCTGGALALPRNTAAVLKYNGFSRGPGGRGRVFLPFLPTDTQDANGEPNTAVRTFIDAFAANLLNPTVVGTTPNQVTFSWILLHRGPPITAEQLIAAASAGKFGQMHKRGDYGRPNVSPI